uniref:Histone deacetylase 10 n=1 Tax=Naja naja TaxID=35670 RepID=A0A8C6VKC2_NAJNA
CWEALLHHSDLHPACKIEVPERLSSCYGRLQHYNLIERCILVSAREGTESEIMLIHSVLPPTIWVLILPTSEGWKAESTLSLVRLELPNCRQQK